ncbi:hypothetical protein NLK92_27305, partial [Klebsiella pneumoniae]|nr:hypothetical protein [Klebsiella pneumoniae]
MARLYPLAHRDNAIGVAGHHQSRQLIFPTQRMQSRTFRISMTTGGETVLITHTNIAKVEYF